MPRRIHAKCSRPAIALYNKPIHTLKSINHCSPQNTHPHSQIYQPLLPAFRSLFPTTWLPPRNPPARQPRRLQNPRPSHFTTNPADSKFSDHLTLRTSPPPTSSTQPLGPCQLFCMHSFCRFFAGERVGCVAWYFLARSFFFRRFFFAPFRVRSIGQCVRFASGRLVHALVSRPLDWSMRSVSRPVDWPMRSFRVYSIGQCARFASGRLAHARSPVGGGFCIGLVSVL